MLERSRPLSPFLHYRWQYTNTLSILHRVTGIAFSRWLSATHVLAHGGCAGRGGVRSLR